MMDDSTPLIVHHERGFLPLQRVGIVHECHNLILGKGKQ